MWHLELLVWCKKLLNCPTRYIGNWNKIVRIQKSWRQLHKDTTNHFICRYIVKIWVTISTINQAFKYLDDVVKIEQKGLVPTQFSVSHAKYICAFSHSRIFPNNRAQIFVLKNLKLLYLTTLKSKKYVHLHASLFCFCLCYTEKQSKIMHTAWYAKAIGDVRV